MKSSCYIKIAPLFNDYRQLHKTEMSMLMLTMPSQISVIILIKQTSKSNITP
jgi:hypothetical protein